MQECKRNISKLTWLETYYPSRLLIGGACPSCRLAVSNEKFSPAISHAHAAAAARYPPRREGFAPAIVGGYSSPPLQPRRRQRV
jgi:hypothetical protein